MTSRSTSALRKPATHKPNGKKNGSKSAAKSKTGKLPEWNLADLYSGIDAPEVTRDLEKMDSECVAFETDSKGKLAEHTAREGGGREGPKWRNAGGGGRMGARTSRISWRIASSNCFTRNPRAVTPPGTGCLIRPSPHCASRSGPRSWRSNRR